MKKLTKEEFILKAKKVHGDKYDYSYSVYINSRTNILIRCLRCGRVFSQNPQTHLQGCGCRYCAMKGVGVKNTDKPNYKGKHLVLGVGVNDLDSCVCNDKCYSIWHSILQRTISKKFKLSQKSYTNATICDEWLVLSNFKKWYDEHHIDGFSIDKDLLSHQNKEYSPNTCVFLPNEINAAITRLKVKRDYPMGVQKHKKEFISVCRGKYLGKFETVEEAKDVYLKAKKEHIIELAEKWKDKIEQRAYDALINLDVDQFFNNN